MSGARKLQTEIDRVMKKVDEGVELFDEIYEKVYSAEQQSQKEKYEVELKKEIKKLQRLRDQIKSWISGSEVKDKDSLLEYRRLIETKMEAFKVVEKETKTKTFSKEGLARKEKLDPEEEKRVETIKWIGETIDQLQTLIDDQDLEIEKLSTGKGKKTNKNQIEDCNQHLLSHKFHMSKLEGIMRLVRNDRIPADTVNEVKEDLDYYVESHEEDDYMMAYDEECFYEVLGLDDLDVVNVDHVTQASTTSSKKKDDDATSASSGSKKAKNATKTLAASGMIPLTIGRAVSSKAKKLEKGLSSNEATPTKISRSNSSVSAGPTPVVGPTPTPKAPVTTAPGGGASMAAVLKRESEERQKAQALQAAAVQAQQQQAEQARQQQQAAELLRQQQLQKQQAEAQRLQQEAVLRQQQAQAVQAQQKAAVAQAEALQRQQAAQLLEQQQRAQVQQQQVVAAQQQDAAKQKMLLQQQAQTQQQQQQAAQAQQQQQQQNVLNVGLAGLSLGDAVGPNNAPGAPTLSSQQQPGGTAPTPATANVPSKDATERYLSALNDSYLQIPTSTETDRSRSYTPRNPYPAAPSCYPSSPSPIFDNPAVFEKLGTDALFFIFYYAQGTYQQYLAARELKKQSWRYHKKYMTWFQRHEEPKVTTDDYEQGTYVYFDYETGWCQRIKSDFRFEYSFLEDSLSV
eukprot:CAMPEP_0172298520 /NCGR_PEP_ID=MMETSP1058-20130122/1139_1 /TAXON_ID=83371 /ORGANISM="Detonula confervacea, Strain CCMP 353" /LENGTH=683 /DNA_ID=CAMNT_0013007797 /DNA_START=132 /DNA_END=2183 /DNA_ORIENTATION=+